MSSFQTPHVPTQPLTSNEELMGKAARLHYDFGLTHHEVSEILRVSRVKVTRLLAQARETGIVQITINSDASPYAALEHQVADQFGLEEAVVVPSFEDVVQQRRAVAHGVANYLQRVLRDGMSLTIGFSRTLALVPDFISPGTRLTKTTFVPLVGGLGRTPDPANAHASTERLAQIFGGRAEHLHAPAVLGTAEVAEALRHEPAIQRALSIASRADIALVGLGGISPESAGLLGAGDITRVELKKLASAGAVGDIAARFFDAQGEPTELDLGARLIGLSLAEIRAIPVRVIAATGSDRTIPLRAALSSGMATVLITDDRTIRSL